MREGLGIARVTRDAPIGETAVEPRVVQLVAGTEVPAVLPIPGEGKLEQVAILLREVGPCDYAAPHHVIHASAQLMDTLPPRAEKKFDLVEPVTVLDDRVMKAGWTMEQRSVECRLDAVGGCPSVKGPRHRMLPIGGRLGRMTGLAGGVSHIRRWPLDVAKGRCRLVRQLGGRSCRVRGAIARRHCDRCQPRQSKDRKSTRLNSSH